MDSDSESKLISLITQLMHWNDDANSYEKAKGLPHIIIQIICLLRSFESESQPKAKSEFKTLIIQAISLFKSTDLDSQPKPLSKLISRCAELVNPSYTDSVAPNEQELMSLVKETISLKPEPKLISLTYQILSLVSYMVMNSKNLTFVCPEAKVRLGDDNILRIDEEVWFPSEYNKWACFNMDGEKFSILGEDASAYFFCDTCKGHNHETATNKIKHPLHPKHSLQLVSLETDGKKRICYCCNEDLSKFIYCCLSCNYAMNMACVEKPQVVFIDHMRRHDHPLALFSRTTSLICDVCALVDSTCSIYVCPPCGFVVHRTCIDLPRVIRISRHPQHRISFTYSFNQGCLTCGVCRKEMHKDYGGYSCIKNGCSYVAHSKCATQRNVWDGIELDGVPEDDIEDVEPFVRISDGIIQHFSHQQHHMRLDENIYRDYDEKKLCQACITPIYFGNLYTCIQCDYILHEECASLLRKMYHPIHPHLLTLVRKDGDVQEGRVNCSACPWYCAVGLFYECRREECRFQVHVQCSVISEPLIHASHLHPLFLTTKPGEKRKCFVCLEPERCPTDETFNCIECDFSLCFGCATLPQNVRYKHDKHTFILSYGKETSTTASWCEICETNIDTEKGFYTCDENCCVILHIECTIGKSLYMKPGSSWFYHRNRVVVEGNEKQMTRPICSYCKRHCPKASFKMFGKMLGTGQMSKEGSIFCSTSCMFIKYFS